MKIFIPALAFATIVAAPAFIPSASAAAPDSARERAIQECSAAQSRDSHDPYNRTGGVQFMYGACMANHGQPQ